MYGLSDAGRATISVSAKETAGATIVIDHSITRTPPSALRHSNRYLTYFTFFNRYPGVGLILLSHSNVCRRHSYLRGIFYALEPTLSFVTRASRYAIRWS